MSDILKARTATPGAATEFRELVTNLSERSTKPSGTLHATYDGAPLYTESPLYFGYGRTLEYRGIALGVHLRGHATAPELIGDHPKQLTHELHIALDTRPTDRIHSALGQVGLGLHNDGSFSIGTCKIPGQSLYRPETLLEPFGPWMTAAVLRQAEVASEARAVSKLAESLPLEPTPEDLAPLVQFAEDLANQDMFFVFHDTPGGHANGVILAQ